MKKKKLKLKNTIQIFLIAIFIIMCLLYLKSKVTYSSYESIIKGNINPAIAKWNIEVNGKNITYNEKEFIADITDVKWNCKNIKSGKTAPGCTGEINMLIDAKNTDVSVLYEIEIIDKTIDETKILNMTSLNLSGANFIKTAPNKYAWINTLDEIKSGKKANINIQVLWDNQKDIVIDKELKYKQEDFIKIVLNAKQYNNEKINKYIE